MERNRLCNVFMSIMFTFFSAVSAISLLLFECTSSPNGKQTLTEDLSVICWESSEWTSMIAVAFACVLVYCVGFGGLFVKAILQAPQEDTFSDKGYQMRWKFLFIKFRPAVYWWALVFLAKNFLLNLGFVVFRSGVAQLYWAMTVTTLYSLLVIFHQPYRARVANHVEYCASVALVYAATLMSWFADREGGKHDDAIVIAAVAISMMPLCAGTAVLVMLFVQGKVRAQQQEDQGNKNYRAFLDRMSQYILLCRENNESGLKFFKSLSDLDMWYLMRTSEAVGAELFRLSCTGQRLVARTTARAQLVQELEEMQDAGSRAATSRSPGPASRDGKVVCV